MITLVTFHAKAAVPEGKKLAVVGNSKVLGNNDPKKAHPLKPIGTNNLWVSTAPAPLPLRVPVRYRYVIINGNDFYESENDELSPDLKNKVFDLVPNGYEMLVEDDEGEFRNLSNMNFEKNKSYTSDSTSERRRREILDSLKNEKMSPNSTVYFISSRLPVLFKKILPSGKILLRQRNTPLTTCLWQLRKGLSFSMKYVGFTEVEELHEGDGDFSKLTSFDEGDCIPLEIPPDILSKSDKFNKNFMWTLFYNIGVWDINEQVPFDWDLWQAYLEVNKIYAKVLFREITTGDMIWVHDYKLLMVPHFVTRLKCMANIGIFVHAIFPTFELFKCLAVREEILRSMLCADIIGFHYFESAKHFLTSCKHLLGLDYQFCLYGMATIHYAGRQVIVHMSHPCINSSSVLRILSNIDSSNNENEFTENSAKINSQKANFIYKFCKNFIKDYPKISADSKCLTDSFIISSVDREIKLSGILLKMKAFNNFLCNYEYARGKVLLIQHICFHDTLFGGNVEMLEKINQLADKINKEYQTEESPFHVIVKVGHLSYEDKYSLFRVTDCLMDTCIRGGINLSAFEYIVCRRGNSASAIISEFTGFSHSLETIVRVNPWHIENITRAIDWVMTMPKEESKIKCDRDFDYINRHDAKTWAESFVREMHWARKKSTHLYLTSGFGKSFRMYTTPSKMIDIHQVMEWYKKSKRKLIVVPFEIWDDLDMKKRVTSILVNITERTSSQVILLDSELHESLLPMINNSSLGIISDDGLYYKVPLLSGDRWVCLVDDVTCDWIDPALKVMSKYVSRTPGSYIEKKKYSISFCYKDSDPDFGAIQAKDITTLLSDLLENLPVKIIHSQKQVQVRLQGVHKGAAVLKIIKHYSELFGAFDYILAFGNDASDEKIFDELAEWNNNRYADAGEAADSNTVDPYGGDNKLEMNKNGIRKGVDRDTPESVSNVKSFTEEFRRSLELESFSDSDNLLENKSDTDRYDGNKHTIIFTCKVGKCPSKANYYIYSQTELYTLLSSIADFDEDN